MNTDRMLALADYLECVVAALPPWRFDMTIWSGDFVQGERCGTAACAVGHGCDVPELAAAGLHLDWRGIPEFAVTVGAERRLLYRFEAVAAFFGITVGDAHYLFGDDKYPHQNPDDITPTEVAARIRALAATAQLA